MPKDGLPRRKFLGAAGVAAVAALGVRCGGDTGSDSPVGAGPRPVPVGIVHGDVVEAAVRRAIELAGGLGDIAPGSSVFIKPNAVYGPVSGSSVVTNTAVLQAVIKVVKERGAARIVVGDCSARGFSSQTVFDKTGLGAAALAAGADEVYAAPTSTAVPNDYVLLQPPHFEETWAAQGGILVMRKLLEADHVVTVPTLKDHRWAIYSLAMKLFIGAIGDSSRESLHGGAPSRLGRDIAILNQMFHPVMTIIDGWSALINGGPEGQAKDAVRTSPQLVFASRDRLAIDACAAAFLKLEQSRTPIPVPDQAQPVWAKTASPWDLPQLASGAQLGLGITGPDQATLLFDNVPDEAGIQRIFGIVSASVADGGADAAGGG